MKTDGCFSEVNIVLSFYRASFAESFIQLCPFIHLSFISPERDKRLSIEGETRREEEQTRAEVRDGLPLASYSALPSYRWSTPKSNKRQILSLPISLQAAKRLSHGSHLTTSDWKGRWGGVEGRGCKRRGHCNE